MNCAGDDTDAEELDFMDFWTPWEILGSYYIEDCLIAYMGRAYPSPEAEWN